MGRLIWANEPSMDQRLKESVANTKLSWGQIAEIVGQPSDVCRQRARRMKYPGTDEPRPHSNIGKHVLPLISSPQAPSLAPDVLWERVEKVTDRDVERHQLERFVDIDVPDERPIGISFPSDQHIRQSGPIQMRRMREDAELIAATDGLYAALAGDGVDNHIKHREAMANGGDKPKDSWKLYDHYIGIMDQKILAMISGNHDDWTRDFTGVDMVQTLARRHALFYAPDEALLRLTLPGQTYQILVRHQYNYNSRFNLGHAVKRLWEMGNDDFDVGVLGHHHEPACEPFIKHGLTRWALRPGSYQFTSSYSRRKGFAHAHATCPTIILWPNRRELMGFPDVRLAAGYLSYLRERWPESDVGVTADKRTLFVA